MEINELDWQHRNALIDELYQVQRGIGELKAREKNIQLQLACLNIRLGRSDDYIFSHIFRQIARKILARDIYRQIVEKVQERLKWADRRIEGDDDEA